MVSFRHFRLWPNRKAVFFDHTDGLLQIFLASILSYDSLQQVIFVVLILHIV